MVFLLTACSNSASQENPKIETEITTDWVKSNKINGVSFVSPPKPINESLITIPKEKTAANYLSIMPYGFVDLESTDLIYNSKWQWWGERSKGAVKLIEMAKKNDYKVMLKPQIWKRGGVYTGEHTYNKSEDWKAFENSYRNFILHFAKIADSLDVSIYAVGTEWKSFVQSST